MDAQQDSSQPPRSRRPSGRDAKIAARTARSAAFVPYITRKVPYYEVLGPEGLELMEHNADTILEEIGTEVRHPAALELLRSLGQDVDGERVRFPRGLARQLVQATAPREFDQFNARRVDDVNVLAIDGFGADAESFGPGRHLSRGGFAVVRVFVVLVVLANVDHGQFPERSHVHAFIKQPLAERAVAEEAGGHLAAAAVLGALARAVPGLHLLAGHLVRQAALILDVVGLAKGGHLLTDHPGWGLVDVYAATIPDYRHEPALHVNYAESVLRFEDGRTLSTMRAFLSSRRINSRNFSGRASS